MSALRSIPFTPYAHSPEGKTGRIAAQRSRQRSGTRSDA